MIKSVVLARLACTHIKIPSVLQLYLLCDADGSHKPHNSESSS